MTLAAMNTFLHVILIGNPALRRTHLSSVAFEVDAGTSLLVQEVTYDIGLAGSAVAWVKATGFWLSV